MPMDRDSIKAMLQSYLDVYERGEYPPIPHELTHIDAQDKPYLLSLIMENIQKKSLFIPAPESGQLLEIALIQRVFTKADFFDPNMVKQLTTSFRELLEKNKGKSEELFYLLTEFAMAVPAMRDTVFDFLNPLFDRPAIRRVCPSILPRIASLGIAHPTLAKRAIDILVSFLPRLREDRFLQEGVEERVLQSLEEIAVTHPHVASYAASSINPKSTSQFDKLSAIWRIAHANDNIPGMRKEIGAHGGNISYGGCCMPYPPGYAVPRAAIPVAPIDRGFLPIVTLAKASPAQCFQQLVQCIEQAGPQDVESGLEGLVLTGEPVAIDYLIKMCQDSQHSVEANWVRRQMLDGSFNVMYKGHPELLSHISQCQQYCRRRHHEAIPILERIEYSLQEYIHEREEGKTPPIPHELLGLADVHKPYLLSLILQNIQKKPWMFPLVNFFEAELIQRLFTKQDLSAPNIAEQLANSFRELLVSDSVRYSQATFLLTTFAMDTPELAEPVLRTIMPLAAQGAPYAIDALGQIATTNPNTAERIVDFVTSLPRDLDETMTFKILWQIAIANPNIAEHIVDFLSERLQKYTSGDSPAEALRRIAVANDTTNPSLARHVNSLLDSFVFGKSCFYDSLGGVDIPYPAEIRETYDLPTLKSMLEGEDFADRCFAFAKLKEMAIDKVATPELTAHIVELVTPFTHRMPFYSEFFEIHRCALACLGEIAVANPMSPDPANHIVDLIIPTLGTVDSKVTLCALTQLSQVVIVHPELAGRTFDSILPLIEDKDLQIAPQAIDLLERVATVSVEPGLDEKVIQLLLPLTLPDVHPELRRPAIAALAVIAPDFDRELHNIIEAMLPSKRVDLELEGLALTGERRAMDYLIERCHDPRCSVEANWVMRQLANGSLASKYKGHKEILENISLCQRYCYEIHEQNMQRVLERRREDQPHVPAPLPPPLGEMPPEILAHTIRFIPPRDLPAFALASPVALRMIIISAFPAESMMPATERLHMARQRAVTAPLEPPR